MAQHECDCKCTEPVGSATYVQETAADCWYWVRCCKHGCPVIWTPALPPRGTKRDG